MTPRSGEVVNTHAQTTERAIMKRDGIARQRPEDSNAAPLSRYQRGGCDSTPGSR